MTRNEIVHCDNCNAPIVSGSDWVAYNDADLCAKCYEDNDDEEEDKPDVRIK